MTTSPENLVARAAEKRGPSEWVAALELFEGGYGAPADLNDPTDRAAFLAILRDEVEITITSRLAEYFKAAADRLDRIMSEGT